MHSVWRIFFVLKLVWLYDRLIKIWFDLLVTTTCCNSNKWQEHTISRFSYVAEFLYVVRTSKYYVKLISSVQLSITERLEYLKIQKKIRKNKKEIRKKKTKIWFWPTSLFFGAYTWKFMKLKWLFRFIWWYKHWKLFGTRLSFENEKLLCSFKI